MRRTTHARGGGTERDRPEAADLGWDDSLYDGPAHAGGRPGPDAVPAAHGQTGQTGHSGHSGHSRDGVPAVADGRDGTGDPTGQGLAEAAPPPRRPGGGRRMLRWSATVLAVLILGTAGAGYLYYEHLNGNLEKDLLNLGDNRLDKAAPDADGNRPLNILLLGSDSRNSAANVRLGGARADAGRKPLADVQMLLHVSADRKNMSVISVPRDTRVTIPRCTDPEDGSVYGQTSATINTSLQHGGPGCTVATWEELTGVPVDHFMMIDFAGVVDMADAVGGVPVCVRDNLQDPKSGLRLKAGETVVKGERALQWLRTRHAFENGSDIGRARAQHQYMNSMIRQLKSGTKLTNPGQLRGLAEAATKALTVDEGLGSVGKLYDLAGELRKVPTGRITMATMPWTEDPQNPAAHLIPEPGDAEQLFSLVRNDIALDGKDRGKTGRKKAEPSDPAAPPAEIPVTVQNGTGTAAQAAVPGRAAAVAQQLAGKGFTRAAADATPKSQADTTVAYPTDELRGDARAVAEALGLPAGAVRPAPAGAAQVTVVIGTDWRTAGAYPPEKGAGEKDDKAPESADALGGDDTSACMDVNPRHTF
ncbi:LCP family protein [Streptomyces zingiberis]|uniref:LCP family protein n=1 Tax=Streptomyces zingiberis TaxID=2053010 RepID=A0ABX1C213_9ACTN|nr:LCP family protein [Streptomyces zingiberis]NJQ02720.1 LCP family protein [Streptomyces zingiberis]